MRTFVNACAKDGSRAVCECTIERLQETLPFKDFDAADKAIRAKQQLAPRTRELFNAATEGCRE